MKPRKLKDFSIKTKIIIEEHRQRIKEGCSYSQPFVCYSAAILTPLYTTRCGGFKNKKELFKWLKETF